MAWPSVLGLAAAAGALAFFAGRRSSRPETAGKKNPGPPPAEVQEVAFPAGDELFREAVDISGAGFFRENASSGSIEGSSLFLEMFGLPQGNEVCFAGIESRIHPEDRSRVKKARERLLSGKEAALEFRFRVSPGSRVVRPVLARVRVVKDAEGRAARILGMVRDLSDKEETESRLRASEELLRQYMENAPSAFSGGRGKNC